MSVIGSARVSSTTLGRARYVTPLPNHSLELLSTQVTTATTASASATSASWAVVLSRDQSWAKRNPLLTFLSEASLRLSYRSNTHLTMAHLLTCPPGWTPIEYPEKAANTWDRGHFFPSGKLPRLEVEDWCKRASLRIVDDHICRTNNHHLEASTAYRVSAYLGGSQKTQNNNKHLQ